MTFKKAIWTFGLQHFVHQCTTCAKYEKPFQMRVQTGRKCSGMVVTILFKFQPNDRVANLLVVALIEIINHEEKSCPSQIYIHCVPKTNTKRDGE